MTKEEQIAWFKKHDKWIIVSLVAVIPILVTVGLFWVELQNRVDDVQKSRAELTYIGCLEQNERNLAATAAIKELFDASVAAGEQTRAEADTAVAATKQIIDALAPHRNCQALVKARFGYVPTVPNGSVDA